MTLRILCLLPLLVTSASRGAEPRTAPPNLLVIVADDLGFSDLGCFGGEIRTPNLDALASAGLRLTRFYNAGRCCPSRASILTGHYPHRVGLGHMVQDLGLPGYRGRVSAAAPTIAQALQTAGYRSFLSGKWHLGTPDPTAHGFEAFYGTLVSAKTFWDPEHFVRLPTSGARPRAVNAALGSEAGFYGTDAVTDRALEFLGYARRTAERPWSLYLAYNAPHFPLQAPKADIAKYAEAYHVGWDVIRARRLTRLVRLGIVPADLQLSPRSPYWDWGGSEAGDNPPWDSLPRDRRLDLARRMAIYAAMVDRMDQNIGRVIENLRAHGELDNTFIWFLSDNGACAEWDPFGFDISSSPNNILHRGEQLEEMGRPGTFHSVGSGWANASNTPWRLYKHYTHEGGISTPCIVHWPRSLGRAGELETRPAHVIDLLPTLIDVAGAGYPGTLELPGRSLAGQLHGDAVAPRALYFEHEGHRAVLEGDWKLVARAREPWALYDIRRDRTEQHDLSQKQPTVVARLAMQWNQWAADNFVTPLPDDYGVEYLPK